MDHYVEVKIRPDPEFTAPMLMGALYSKLHRSLVGAREDCVGVSFPAYSARPRALGDVLRLHGSAESLSSLMESQWLQGMADHVAVTNVRPVPVSSNQALVRRRQFKTNAERLRRRRMKRKQESYEQALAAIPDTVEREPDLPYLTLRSQSTGQSFRLFVEQTVQPGEPRAGVFNGYGLSQSATVPWF